MSTRWWCQRCKRPLGNAPRGEKGPKDHVTYDKPSDTVTHAQCGGPIAFSVRAKP